MLALPAAQPAGPSDVLERLEGEDVVTQGLLFPDRERAVHAFGAEPEQVLRVSPPPSTDWRCQLRSPSCAASASGRTSSLPATLAAFLSPAAWWGATSPTDYGPGVFGAAVLLWSLFRLPESVPRGLQWRDSAARPRVHAARRGRPPPAGRRLGVSRHPAKPHEAPIRLFSVYAVFMLSVAIGLSGPSESTLLAHFAERTLAGAEPSLEALIRWPAWWIVGFGATLLGTVRAALREARGRRATGAALARTVVSRRTRTGRRRSPEFGPIGTFLVPAGALGLADWLNRRGERSAEARWGTIVLAAQVGFLIASQRTLVQ